MLRGSSFDQLKGLVINDIHGLTPGSEQVLFLTTCGRRFVQEHVQDCCESVDVAEVVGDVDDLIDSPVLLAEEVEHENVHPPGVAQDFTYESFTWTFYKLVTIRGAVTIRWLGTSNGYYSEGVNFYEDVRLTPSDLAQESGGSDG